MTVEITIAPTVWTIKANAHRRPIRVGGGCAALCDNIIYHISQQQAWNLGEVTLYSATAGTTDTIIQDRPGLGNGNAWLDSDGTYHGTIHGNETDVVIWAELDGVTIDCTATGTYRGGALVVYRTSVACGQNWTWEWRPTFNGWYDKFTMAYPVETDPYLSEGYTGMLVTAGDFINAREDADPTEVPIPYTPGSTTNTFMTDLQDLYLLKASSRVILRVHWREAYTAFGNKHFLQTRETPPIVKYYPTWPVLTAGETRVYQRDCEITT